MRVIAGEFKGRKLTCLAGKKIRPTSDRIREALFSILLQKIDNALVLDLFAGTGALGIEALSRGAAKSIFVDISKQAIQIINKNIELLKLEKRTKVIECDASTVFSSNILEDFKFDLIFVDPPYNKGFLQSTLMNIDLLKIMGDDSIIIVEHSKHANNLQKMPELDFFDKKTYGNTSISFFKQKTKINLRG